MEMRKCLGTMLLLFLIFIPNIDIFMEAEAEAERCWVPSKTFEGPCIRSEDCFDACVTENYPYGECKVVIGKYIRCMCYMGCLST
nr:defensin D2-like [Coffea arabica]XP_027102547.1 defensin D2-like [Coffea arabica]